jgi:superfamily II DNA helicase RecQ
MKNQIEGLRARNIRVHMLCSETTFIEKREVSLRVDAVTRWVLTPQPLHTTKRT